ncbi:MAG: class I SAM-dependent methyltransferase [Thermoanaerobaculia bacterium]
MTNEPRDTKERFTDRVADYVRARPSYPKAVVTDLEDAGALFPGARIADIGAGTGISTALFLEADYDVVAVEPNAAMRAAAEERFHNDPKFRSIAGSAEATGLGSASVDLVVAAQAFHWFDLTAARAEFLRILRDKGPVALIWNARRGSGTPFAEAYEKLLLEFGTDYREVGHRGVGSGRLQEFFGGAFTTTKHENFQELDLDGLRARLLSSSYVPAEGTTERAAMLVELGMIFAANATGGHVRLEYDTELSFGPLAP